MSCCVSLSLCRSKCNNFTCHRVSRSLTLLCKLNSSLCCQKLTLNRAQCQQTRAQRTTNIPLRVFVLIKKYFLISSYSISRVNVPSSIGKFEVVSRSRCDSLLCGNYAPVDCLWNAAYRFGMWNFVITIRIHFPISFVSRSNEKIKF